jgi:hypothetical protein
VVSRATSGLLLDLRHRPARRIEGERGWLFRDYNRKIYRDYRVGSLRATRECVVGSWSKEDGVVLGRKVMRAKEGNELVLWKRLVCKIESR